jgi:hypothetical protein
VVVGVKDNLDGDQIEEVGFKREGSIDAHRLRGDQMGAMFVVPHSMQMQGKFRVMSGLGMELSFSDLQAADFRHHETEYHNATTTWRWPWPWP